MSVEVTFEETYNESREITFAKDSVNQTIVCHIKGDFAGAVEQDANGIINDDLVMLEAMYPYLPIFYTVPLLSGEWVILVLDGIKAKPINTDAWRIELSYATPKNGGKSGGGMGTEEIGDIRPDFGENGGAGWSENYTQLSFNLSQTSRKRDFSLALLDAKRNLNTAPNGTPYPLGIPAPIGHTEDGVEGVEVYDSSFQFQVTSYFPPEKLRYAYVRKLKLMHTRVNSNIWFGFPPGSVLFLEANASGDPYQVVPVTFSFEVRNNFKFSQNRPTRFADPNIDDPNLMYDTYNEPMFLDSPVYSGWSHVDYRYLPVADNVAKMTFQQPIFRFIHQLYGYANFEAFEI